ncbi:hypothetical protein EDB87DRAFT_607514 [Lactarius vividus]|nr:hypothetical protein EDB87DRAFT_607514 [Lactarius vividus]
MQALSANNGCRGDDIDEGSPIKPCPARGASNTIFSRSHLPYDWRPYLEPMFAVSPSINDDDYCISPWLTCNPAHIHPCRHRPHPSSVHRALACSRRALFACHCLTFSSSDPRSTVQCSDPVASLHRPIVLSPLFSVVSGPSPFVIIWCAHSASLSYIDVSSGYISSHRFHISVPPPRSPFILVRSCRLRKSSSADRVTTG